MRFFKRNKVEKSNRSETRMPFKNVIDGSVLTRDGVIEQLPYILFLTFIAIIYIGNRYNAEKIARQSMQIQDELKELRAESITSASHLMFASKQSQVARLVNEKGLGLKEAVEPPKRLIIHKNER